MQRYLAKSYHTEAHRTRIPALVQMYGAEVEDMLLELEAWLRTKNESVADPLLEAFEESLPLQRLNVPSRLRNTLRSTNSIGSMFSLVRHCERTITHTSSGSRSISRMTRDGMAEGARFELADPLRGLQFSRLARSAAPSPLHILPPRPGARIIALDEGICTSQSSTLSVSVPSRACTDATHPVS